MVLVISMVTELSGRGRMPGLPHGLGLLTGSSSSSSHRSSLVRLLPYLLNPNARQVCVDSALAHGPA